MNYETFADTYNFPELDVSYAERILRKDPPVIVERKTHGTLVADILKASTVPMGVFITPEGVAGVELEPQINQDYCVAAMDAASALMAGSGFTFTVMEGALKSKVLTVEGFEVEISATLDGSPTSNPFITGILVPSLRWYSAATLVNRIESICMDSNSSWIIFVDQRAETIRFKCFPGELMTFAVPPLHTFLASMDDPPPVSVAFLTSFAGGPPDYKSGWE